MGFYWIVGLDISSSFQLSRHLHRGGLNIFILSFELNNRSSCINLGSNSLMSYVHIYIYHQVWQQMICIYVEFCLDFVIFCSSDYRANLDILNTP